jgi:hypothetical protein
MLLCWFYSDSVFHKVGVSSPQRRVESVIRSLYYLYFIIKILNILNIQRKNMYDSDIIAEKIFPN